LYFFGRGESSGDEGQGCSPKQVFAKQVDRGRGFRYHLWKTRGGWHDEDDMLAPLAVVDFAGSSVCRTRLSSRREMGDYHEDGYGGYIVPHAARGIHIHTVYYEGGSQGFGENTPPFLGEKNDCDVKDIKVSGNRTSWKIQFKDGTIQVRARWNTNAPRSAES